MGLRGIGSFIKYSMFLFNAVILVAGLCLVGFGIYTNTSGAAVAKFSTILGSNLLPTVSLVLIITGAVIIVLAFLGCCGAIKEVKCMLVLFFLLLLLMFVSFLVGGILFYAFREKIENATLNHLSFQLRNLYGKKGEEPVTEAWDSMQKLFKCCGIQGDFNSTESWSFYKGQTDWFANGYYADHSDYDIHLSTVSTMYVPLSCCIDSENTPNVTKCQGVSNDQIIPKFGPPVLHQSQLNDQLYTEGCYTSLHNIVESNIVILIGVGAGIAVAMVLGMIFSICLCRRIRDDEDYDDCD
ncbi:hypothetical protein ACF0H5_013841 [Mactra antiquata]